MRHLDYGQRRQRYWAVQDALVHRRPSRSPWIVEVEPTTDCQLTCAFCPRDSLRRPRGRISDKDFDSILASLGKPPDGGMLLFSGFGEPLLHDRLPRLVVAAGEAGWFCGLTTNGLRLTPATAERLVDAGLDVLQVSLPAFTERTYRKTVRGGSYRQVVSNVQAVAASCANRVVLALNFVLTPGNRMEARRFASFWRRRGISQIHFSRRHNRGGHLRGLPREGPSGSTARRGAATDCWIYRNTLYVTWDGRLLACCNDLGGETERGDLRHASLDRIRRAGGPRSPAFSICERCDFPFRG